VPGPTLDAVGSRYVGDPIPITGSTRGVPAGTHRLVLQRSSTHGWSTAAVEDAPDGFYRFADQRASTPGSVRYRTLLYVGKQPAAVSNVVSVEVLALPARPPACANDPSPATCPKPAPITEQRTVQVPDCPRLTVTTRAETASVMWRWDAGAGRWQQEPAPWAAVPGTDKESRATAADCVRVGGGVPAGAVLPDIRIKDLTRCGRGDARATGGTCFMIVPSAPHDPDFPQLEGRKLLKFAVITLNLGRGPAEIIAERSATDATDWRAYEDFYDAHGTLLGSVADPGVQFYYAGDGHNHWHVRDFDDYDLLDATGTRVARAEKHGYCMEDDTTYDPVQGRPWVEPAPVYTEDASCGEEQPDALTIVHGLAPGWGDTYPTSLPDQAIDITGLPDGEYTVRVHADAVGAVKESDERNNVAEVKVRIRGDAVHVVPGSSTGGLP
jgi:hypothetical protein